MKLEVQITKVRFFVLLATLLLLGGVFFVYAYNAQFDKNSDAASSFGHSADEVVVKMSNGNVKTVQELLSGGGGILGAPDFESGWIDVNNADKSRGVIAHNLNTDNFKLFKVIFRVDAAGKNDEVIFYGMNYNEVYVSSEYTYSYGIEFFIDKSDEPLKKIKYGIAGQGPYYMVSAGDINWGSQTPSSGQIKISIWR